MKRGFTLIEVLIVVFIIGLLASVVLVGLGAFRARGRDARRVADLRSIQNGLELYYGKFSSYPSGNFADMKQNLLLGDIGVKNIPNDPSGGSYQYGTNGQEYVLGAKLEDPNNSALKDDVDGSGAETFGVECGNATNDEFYCIAF